MKLLYSSSNGDRWFLVEILGQSYVRHEPNLSSGGTASDTPVDEFLRRSGQGPEHEELRRYLGEAGAGAARGGETPPVDMRPITAAQIRAARGLLGWSEEALARETHLSVADIASCESGHGAPPYEHLVQIARVFSLGGVVLLAEGEVSTGGPGVRMGALGTSTGQSVEQASSEVNDNERARERSAQTING
jgi:hypothetical protein